MVYETAAQSGTHDFGTAPRRRRGGPNRGTGDPSQGSSAQQRSRHCHGVDYAGPGDGEESASRKHPFRPYHAIRVPKSANLQGATNNLEEEPAPTVTTVMLRHIPNKYTQATLLQELNRMGFTGRYDFFYLPMDVHNRTNVGYAFVNFLTPQDALCFSRTLTNYKFQQHSSQKIATVCPAHVQGLVRNLFHFSNRAVAQSRDIQYRPVVVRNGCYRDCCEVLAEMLVDAEQTHGHSTQHVQRQHQQQRQQQQQQQRQQPPPAMSYLNPSAKVFVPMTAAPEAVSLGGMAASAPTRSQPSFEDASEDCRLMTGFDSTGFASEGSFREAPNTTLLLSLPLGGGPKVATEPEQDKEFENAVLNWLQDEDPKKSDKLDVSSTDEGSHGSASGLETPTRARLGGTSVTPDSGQSSNRSVYFPLLPH